MKSFMGIRSEEALRKARDTVDLMQNVAVAVSYDAVVIAECLRSLETVL